PDGGFDAAFAVAAAGRRWYERNRPNTRGFAMTWQPEMDELRRRQEMAKRMGGADKVKRQHDGGRLTVRERIDRLVDKDIFREIGSIAGKAEYDGRNDLVDLMPANAVMGRGKIDGRHVAVTGDDFTVRGGSADATIKEKDIFI